MTWRHRKTKNKVLCCGEAGVGRAIHQSYKTLYNFRFLKRWCVVMIWPVTLACWHLLSRPVTLTLSDVLFHFGVGWNFFLRAVRARDKTSTAASTCFSLTGTIYEGSSNIQLNTIAKLLTEYVPWDAGTRTNYLNKRMGRVVFSGKKCFLSGKSHFHWSKWCHRQKCKC